MKTFFKESTKIFIGLILGFILFEIFNAVVYGDPFMSEDLSLALLIACTIVLVTSNTNLSKLKPQETGDKS